MIDLKLRRPSKAKAKVRLKKSDLFDEIEEDADQPSTSGYIPPQECSSTRLESGDDNRSLQSTRLRQHRRISNRDSSNNMPQKRKLFFSNNSPSSDNLSPHTPFTRGDAISRKKMHQELIVAKRYPNIKDVRIILDKRWSDKMNLTGGTNTGLNPIQELAYNPQQSPQRQKDESSGTVIATRPDRKELSGGDNNSDSNTYTELDDDDLMGGTGTQALFSDL